MSERVKTLYLWLLECREGSLTRLFTFYAIDEEEAENQVSELFTERPHLVRISLAPRPGGFIFLHFQLPGHIECKGEYRFWLRPINVDLGIIAALFCRAQS